MSCFFSSVSSILMVEQTESVTAHNHSVFVACLQNQVVSGGSARLYNVFGTAGLRPVDVIRKREERIRRQSHAVHLVQELALLFQRKRFRFGLEEFRPVDVYVCFRRILHCDVSIDKIIFVRTASSGFSTGGSEPYP